MNNMQNTEGKEETFKREENRIKEWIRENKKELIYTGIGTGITFLAVVLGIKNIDKITDLLEDAHKRINNISISKPTATIQERVPEIVHIARPYTYSVDSFNVSEHIRNLPKGAHASAEKLLEAIDKGIELLPNQTFVNAYEKGGKIA